MNPPKIVRKWRDLMDALDADPARLSPQVCDAIDQITSKDIELADRAEDLEKIARCRGAHLREIGASACSACDIQALLNIFAGGK